MLHMLSIDACAVKDAFTEVLGIPDIMQVTGQKTHKCMCGQRVSVASCTANIQLVTCKSCKQAVKAHKLLEKKFLAALEQTKAEGEENEEV